MRHLTASSPATAAVAILLIGTVWAVAAAIMPAFPQNIDEMMYVIATEAFAERGALTLENGFERFGGADALRPVLAVVGPSGFATQYPSGYFILAAPFSAAFGIHGMLVLNLLAGMGCLALCRALAVRLFGDGRIGLAAVLILGLATFLTDHVLALSPHVLSVLVVLGASLFVARAVLGPADRAVREALFAGLCLGVGVLIRVDVVLAGPPLAVWTLLHARRPLALAVAGGIGLLPGLAAATALNWEKFGIVFPLSYGRVGSGGGVDPGSHLWVAVACGLALLAALLLRLPEVRRRAGWLGLAAVAALGGAAVLVPALAGLLGDIWTGVRALLWDMRLNPDGRAGVTRLDGGLVLFWGMIKTSLLQSLPWLGVLAVLLFRPPGRDRQAGLILLILFPLLWVLPYLPTAWHGGPGRNLRYFLPILPFLAILGALAGHALLRIGREDRRAVRLWFGLTAVALGALTFGVAARGGYVPAYLQYALPQWLALFLALVSAGAAASTSAPRAAAGAGIGAAALGLACVFGLALEPADAFETRRSLAQREARVAAIPERSLVYSVYPFLLQLRRLEAYQAWVTRSDHEPPSIDPRLTREALAAGVAVFVEGEDLARIAEETLEGVVVRQSRSLAEPRLYRLDRVGGAASSP